MAVISGARKSLTCFGQSLKACPSRISRAAFIFLPILLLNGILRAVGDGLQRAGLGWAQVFSRTADYIFAAAPLFLAICLAWILTGENQITASFSGGLAWLIIHKTAELTSGFVFPGTDIVFQSNIFTGLLAGFAAALFFKITRDRKLPAWLMFFSGDRLLPIAILPVAVILGGLFGFLWTLVESALRDLVIWISAAGPAGAFVYGTLSSWLMPFGLDNVLHQKIWYDLGNYTNLNGELVTGEISRFMAGDPEAGMLLAGFYPMVIFGIPAFSASIIISARKGRRLILGSCFAAAALLSLISGVTLPFEIMLLFISPPLFLLYGLLGGLSMFLTSHLDIYHGFLHGAGIADYLTYWHFAVRPQILLVVGAVMAGATFAVTYAAIRWLRFPAAGNGQNLLAGLELATEAEADAGLLRGEGNEPEEE